MNTCRQAEVTVADLTEQGVDAVDASCPRCSADWRPPITFLPPATTLATIEALMVCPACGGRDIEIQEPARFERRSVQ
jgi:Zn finger protein HypA/HybF involved in hydrogenase expression